MSLQPFPDFKHFNTHHCVSGSLRHIYIFNHFPISEEMLLGLGAGVGFIYWHTKGTLPFLGGRSNIERPGVEGFEKTVGRRTGVRVDTFHTASRAKAEKTLIEMLQGGQPVMLVLDMGFLPYFDFGGQDFHFGYHVVVACGYDSQQGLVLLADRDEVLHPVSLEALAKARGSKFKPFPPQHAWYTFDFRDAHPPDPVEIHRSIDECAQGMLEPPINNFGVKGIRKAGKRICDWTLLLSEKELREACINTAIMIDARGGSGGGLFRYMYARYLEEAGELTGYPDYKTAGKEMAAIGDCWEDAAGLFEQAFKSDHPDRQLMAIGKLLPEIADREENTWVRLKYQRG